MNKQGGKMRKMLMLGALMALVSVLGAADTQLDPNSVVINSNASRQVEQEVPDVRVAVPVDVENNPFYYSLELLTQQERENAVIEIMFMEAVPQDIKYIAQDIEQTWNTGSYEQALNMLADFNAIPGVEGNAVLGVAWRTPVQAPMTDWGDDVLISARDSIFVLAMDHNMTTHNLFALLGFTGDGMGSKFSANFSSDGGQTWFETYALGGFTYVMNDLDACCVSNHFYVAYTGGLAASPNSMAWLMRFKILDGQRDTFPNGSTTFNVFTTTEIMDVDISSNHEQFNNRLYFYCIDNAGTIHNFFNDPSNVTWTGIATNVNNAQQGLDTDWNVNYSTYSSIMSFITDEDSVEIYGRNGTTWDNLNTYNIISTPFDYWTTAIGGHNDTLFCAFSYTGVFRQIRYLIQYGNATPWLYGFLAPDTMENNWTADVTLRGSGGIHGTYRGPLTSAAYYRSRPYSGGWTTPLQYNDHSVSGEIRPQIEFVGNGNYGILYRRPMSAVGVCYFDRSDWVTGVAEYKVDDLVSQYISLAPNPVHTTSVLSFVTRKEGSVRITLYDAVGRLVDHVIDGPMNAGNHSVNIEAQKLPAGIYFVHVETPEGAGTKTMTIVR
jgi:hypothetical protein